MNIHQHLIALGYEVSEFNTNNGWGFGGAIGKSYTNGVYEVRIGRACYRHHPDVKYVTITRLEDGIKVLDKNGSITPSKFDSIIESL